VLKQEFITRAAHASGESKTTVRRVLDAAAAVTRRAVSNGEPVFLFGLGKLSVVQRGEKRARNIRTGETVVVPPRKAVLLQPSDSLVEAANSKQ
jgi:DNA-binding protein HU-beta